MMTDTCMCFPLLTLFAFLVCCMSVVRRRRPVGLLRVMVLEMTDVNRNIHSGIVDFYLIFDHFILKPSYYILFIHSL